MDNYLIAVDLDDTLLTAEKSITPKSKAYIRKKAEEGHRFIINTGAALSGRGPLSENAGNS